MFFDALGTNDEVLISLYDHLHTKREKSELIFSHVGLAATLFLPNDWCSLETKHLHWMNLKV